MENNFIVLFIVLNVLFQMCSALTGPAASVLFRASSERVFVYNLKTSSAGWELDTRTPARAHVHTYTHVASR